MTQKANSIVSILVPVLLIAVMILSAFPASAVNGLNSQKPLNYGLHWFRMAPDGAPGPATCGKNRQAFDPQGNAVYYECIDAVRLNGATGRWEEDPLTQFGQDPYYDPQRPTIIYFHGWQPGGGDTREDFAWALKDNDTVPWDTLRVWKTNGWNVGLFYWNQFADTPLPLVSHAEGKIWSSNSNYGMQYRYNDGSQLNKKPTAEDLGLPMLSRSLHPHVRWDNRSDISQALSIVNFVRNQDPAGQEAVVSNLVLDLQTLSCEDVVQREACGGGVFNSPICTQSDDWREVFLTKACQTPSVSDLAFQILNIALASQSNQDVIYSGHSLGHQMATRTATHMWMAYHNAQAQAAPARAIASNRLQSLPKRLELFDPYATTYSQSYLTPYTYDGNGLDTKKKRYENRKTSRRVYNYVKRLKQLTALSGVNIPVSYYHSSILGHSPSSTTNPELIGETAYQRNRFDYVSPVALSFKHAGSRFWYFKSREEGAAYPPLSNTSNGITLQQGLSSRSTGNHVRQAMATGGANGVSFRQTSGMKQRPLDQAVFTATDLANLGWPGNVDMNDLGEARAAVERRLFNNSLTITSDNTIDAVYVNGENLTANLANADKWWIADTLANLDLHNGHNVIAVKASDAGGVAALIAELEIDGELFVSNGDWKVTRSTPPSDWMETDFDDSQWDSATVHDEYGNGDWGTGVSGLANDSPAGWIWSSDKSNHNTVYFRYEISASGPWKVRTVPIYVFPITSLSSATWQVQELQRVDFQDGDDDHSWTADVLNFSASGSQGNYSGDSPLTLSQPYGSDYVSYAFEATGTIDIETAGNYTFGFHVNGGAQIKITKDRFEQTVASVDNSSGAATDLGTIYLDPGQYEIEIIAYGSKANGALEVFAAKGSHSSWNANDFKLLLPNDHLDRINLTEEPDVCPLPSAGIRTGQVTGITHAPQSISFSVPYKAAFLPQMQTMAGTDPSDVRSLITDSTGFLNIEEENSLDGVGGELNHAPETVGWIGTSSQSGSETIRDAGNHPIGWAPGPRALTQSWTTINLPHTFIDPVVIAHVKNRAEPVHIRLRNVGANSFQARLERWTYHPYETSSVTGNMVFLVVEAGVHYMRGGQVLQAGKTPVHQTIENATKQINFPVAFSQSPVVLSMSQTVAGSAPMVTRHSNINSSSFRVVVQEEEKNDGKHMQETIGWVAATGNSDIVRFDNCP